jgi:hypothetical protein
MPFSQHKRSQHAREAVAFVWFIERGKLGAKKEKIERNEK